MEHEMTPVSVFFSAQIPIADFQRPLCQQLHEELYYKAARNVAGTIKIIEHESNKYVTKSDGTGDYSISKSKFVELIEGDVGAFKDISFLEFQKIFDVLQKILNDSRANN